MVAIKTRFTPGTADLVAAVYRLERYYNDRFPQVAWLFVEPDYRD